MSIKPLISIRVLEVNQSLSVLKNTLLTFCTEAYLECHKSVKSIKRLSDIALTMLCIYLDYYSSATIAVKSK